MGWWRIGGKGGGIGPNPSGERSSLVNAVPGRHSSEDFFNGDEPADILGRALVEVNAAYQRAWKRPAAEEELRAAFEFVLPTFTGGGR